ncbi:MAG: cupin domain-containing protein [Proteobacteria bacterium]|nr:cupin domain-containing protein [Pseudomonadota bacterium]
MGETTRWDALPSERISDHIRRRMVWGEKLMLVRWEFARGGYVAMHRHPHEQVVVVESGRLKMNIAGEEVALGPGDIRVIPPDTPHDAEVLEDARVMDVFSPPREDFLGDEGPGYLTHGR